MRGSQIKPTSSRYCSATATAAARYSCVLLGPKLSRFRARYPTQHIPASGSLAYFIYSLAYATGCPSVHASTTLQQPSVRHSRRTDTRFHGAARHRRGQRARARLSLSTQVAQWPNLGVQVGTRGRSERLPGFPQSLLVRHVIGRWLFFGDPLFFVLVLPRQGPFFPFPSVAHLRPCSRPIEVHLAQPQSHLGHNGGCVYSPQLPVPRDNGPSRYTAEPGEQKAPPLFGQQLRHHDQQRLIYTVSVFSALAGALERHMRKQIKGVLVRSHLSSRLPFSRKTCKRLVQVPLRREAGLCSFSFLGLQFFDQDPPIPPGQHSVVSRHCGHVYMPRIDADTVVRVQKLAGIRSTPSKTPFRYFSHQRHQSSRTFFYGALQLQVEAGI